MKTIVAGTGHRPDKIGGYSDEVFNKLVEIAKSALTEYKANTVISGMALGWDLALAEAAIALNIPFIAAVPFKGQESKWPSKSQSIYNNVLQKASRVVIVSEGGYDPKKMQVRNEWMVNNCNLLLCLYNGDNYGGTYNCIQYAKKTLSNNQIINLYDKL